MGVDPLLDRFLSDPGAEVVDLEPGRGVRPPHLRVGYESEVCGHFEAAVQRAFQQSKVALLATDGLDAWPGARLAFSERRTSGALTVIGGGLKSLYGDGDWLVPVDPGGTTARGALWINAFLLSSSVVYDYRILDAEKTSQLQEALEDAKDAEEPWRVALTHVELIPNPPRATWRRGIWGHVDIPKLVVTADGKIYYQDMPRLTLMEVVPDGPPQKVCEMTRTVSTQPERGADEGEIGDHSVIAAMRNTLQAMQGSSCQLSEGTARSASQLRDDGYIHRYNVLYRPWSSSDGSGGESRAALRAELSQWSSGSPVARRHFQSLTELYREAVPLLERHVQETFGVRSPRQKRAWARKLLSRYISSHFRFPVNGTRERRPVGWPIYTRQLASSEARRFVGLVRSQSQDDAARQNAEAELMIAAVGQPDMVRALAVEGVAVDGRSRIGKTPLMFAVELGERSTVDTLVSLGADVHATTEPFYNRGDHRGLYCYYGSQVRTPLRYSLDAGHYPLAVDLIDGGARPTGSDRHQAWVESFLAQSDRSPEKLAALSPFSQRVAP